MGIPKIQATRTNSAEGQLGRRRKRSKFTAEADQGEEEVGDGAVDQVDPQ